MTPEWILVMLMPFLAGFLAALLGWAVCWIEAVREGRSEQPMTKDDQAE